MFGENKEFLNPICNICKKGHKTSEHGALEKLEKENEFCEVCTRNHKTKDHDLYRKEEFK